MSYEIYINNGADIFGNQATGTILPCESSVNADSTSTEARSSYQGGLPHHVYDVFSLIHYKHNRVSAI